MQLILGVGVDEFTLPASLARDLDAVQGWDGRVDAPGLDHGSHVAEEQGQQQGADVRAVDVGIGHEDDLAVSSLRQVEGTARARADHLDDVGALGVGQHVRGRGLLHVEDLASNREKGLVVGVARGLGRAQGGVTLDDEELGLLDVLEAAVRELGGQRGGFERVLLARDLLVQSRGNARLHLADDLLHEEGGLLLVVALGGGELGLQPVGDHAVDDGADLGRAQRFLRLSLELRLGEAHGDDGGHAGLDVVLFGAPVLRADLELARVLVDRGAQGLEDRLLEAGDVGAALGGGDDVDEGLDGRVVADAPAQRDVDLAGALDLGGAQVPGFGVQGLHGLVVGALARDVPRVGDGAVGGQPVREVDDAAVEAEALVEFLLAALVVAVDGQAGNEERGLAGTRQQVVPQETRGGRENLEVRPKAHARAGLGFLHLADGLEGRAVREGRKGRVGGALLGVVEFAGFAAAEAHLVGLAAAIDLHVEAGGQGVHDGGADAVQTAGGRVGAAAELTAGVELGVDDLDARQALAGHDVDGDASAVVGDGGGVVGVEAHIDGVAVSFQSLIDGVVDDLPEAVHEASVVGGADVHAGALAHRLETFEDREVPCVVVG